MPKAGHLYKLNEEVEEIPTFKVIQKALKKYVKKIYDEEDEIDLHRNFSDITIKDTYIMGVHQIDIPIYIEKRDGSRKVDTTLVESDFVIKDNGKIIFFGKKKRSKIFASDISASFRTILSPQVPDEVCIKHTVPLKVMQACINAPEMQSITYSAFEGSFDTYTNRQSLGGENLQQSTIFANLQRRGRLYRLIIRIITDDGELAVQITEDGLILGYGVPSPEILLEIVEFLERHGL
jgi:hypothetical protein